LNELQTLPASPLPILTNTTLMPAQSLLRRLTRFKRSRATPPATASLPSPSPSISSLSGAGSLADYWRSLRGGPALPERINLALQGGGAHGAFTWGVLDALLDDPRIQFEGLSGSSAGAMNAVVFANGWMLGAQKGGPEAARIGARQALADFWTEVGKQMPLGMTTQGEGETISLSPASRWLANWAGYFSPSQLNPLALNPLRDLLERQIDFEQLRGNSPFKLFIAATQANTGKLRVFRENELCLDVLLASSCLPKISRAVEIDGEPYWDGGYSANPAVSPLFYGCDSTDVLLVLLSPLQHQATPNSVEQIESRIAELAFSANFMREMQMFTQVAEYSRPAFLSRDKFARRLQKMRFHMIDSSDLPILQRTETKLLAHAPFLELLRGQGHERGQAWLFDHAPSVGHRSTISMKKLFA
jgi:NTE family protein